MGRWGMRPIQRALGHTTCCSAPKICWKSTDYRSALLVNFAIILVDPEERWQCFLYSYFYVTCALTVLRHSRDAALECCDKGKTFQCQETCRSALKAGEPDAVGLMVKDCGELLLTEPLWKCFMSKSPPSSPDRSAHSNDRAINDIRNR